MEEEAPSILDAEQWHRVSAHLDRVLELPEPGWNGYVEELKRADLQTGTLLARLLSAHRQQK